MGWSKLSSTSAGRESWAWKIRYKLIYVVGLNDISRMKLWYLFDISL